MSSHLDSDEIDELLRTKCEGDAGDLPSHERPENARNHLSNCGYCQARYEAQKREMERLASLFLNSPGAPSVDCPSEEIWLAIAAGVSNQNMALVLSHASICDHCGPLLRDAVADLDTEVTPQEEGSLSRLASDGVAWQRKLAGRLARANPDETSFSFSNSPRTSLRLFSARFAWVFSIAAALIVGISVSWVAFKRQDASVQNLLQQAYSEQRPFELRISGAPYGPLKVNRGAAGSRFSQPTPLLKADAIIATELPKHSNDSAWQAAKGTAELLDRNYDKAIESLKSAAALSPGSIPIQIDLATAYSERGETQNQPWDQATAVETLKSVLKQRPNELVALFNLAIVLERQGLFHEAVKSWTEYLNLDANSSWADEARKALERDNEHIKNRGSLEPILKPTELIAELQKTEREVSGRIDRSFEEYLAVATSQWLTPALSTKRNTVPPNPYLNAVKIVARVAEKKHGDSWLSDILKQHHSSLASRASSDLSASLYDNEIGDHADAALKARRAAREFVLAGNRPGYLRSKLEEAYSARLSHDALTCAGLASPLIDEMGRRHYAWAHVQAALEMQECLNMLGRMGRARSLSNLALRAAEANHYPVLYLRALFFAADANASLGDVRSAWRQTNEGLLLSWGVGVPPMRTYSFETELDYLAQQISGRQFDAIVLEEATQTIESDQDSLLRAMAHERFAEAALAAGDPATAEKQFQITAAAFTAAPKTPVTANHLIEAKVGVANLEVQQRHFQSAVRDLMCISKDVSKISNRFILMDYYRALERSRLELGDIPGGSAALEAALRLTESALATLRSDKERIQWDQVSAGIYRDAVALRLRQQDTSGALEIWEWYRAAPIRVRSTRIFPKVLDQAGLPKPEWVQNKLRSLTKETVVSFAIIDGGLAIWAYDNRGIRYRRVTGIENELSFRSNLFAELCADPLSDRGTLTQLGRKLYDMLLGGFSDFLVPERFLIFEPDGPLWTVPMQALVMPGGRFLAERFTITDFPGIYYSQVQNRPPVFRGAERAVVIASGDASNINGTMLPQLTNVKAEARDVAKYFRSTTVLNDSVLIQIVAKELANAQIFHFAGHAVGTPDGGVLVISTSARSANKQLLLSVDTLSRLPLKSIQLAVLSACSTKVGVEENGPLDQGSLAGTFLRAGVSQTVASSWTVDSVVTERFMSIFYRSLVTQKTVPESVRDASLGIEHQNSTSHPYYWAAFTTFGWA